MQLSDLAQAIIFLIPGFLAVEFKNFLTPTRRRSDFERLVESVVLSLAAFVVTYGVLLSISRAARIAFPNTRDPAFIAPDWIIALALGYSWARVLRSSTFSRIVEKLFGVQYTSEPSFWAEVLRSRNAGPYRGGWVRVYLDDGTKYIGAVTRFTTDPNQSDKELVLEEVYSVDENGLPTGDPLPIKVYIPGSRIVTVHILPRPTSRET